MKFEQRNEFGFPNAPLSVLAVSLADAAPLCNMYQIVESPLGVYEFDGIEWDCYGEMHFEGPELVQIALHGSEIDLYPLLSGAHLATIQGVIEREWLEGKK